MREKKIRFFGYFARVLLRTYNPFVIVIAGTDGKRSTATAISHTIRADTLFLGNQDEDILGAIAVLFRVAHAPKKLLDYPLFFFKILLFLIWPQRYPEFVVMELEAMEPGDMRYAGEIFMPDILVFPAIAISPENASFQNNRSIQKEYSDILHYLQADGYIVANTDDNNSFAMTRIARHKRCVSYGFHGESQLLLSDYRIVYAESYGGPSMPSGIDYTISYNDETFGCHRSQTVGHLHAYTGAAAFVVSDILQVPPTIAIDKIAQATIAPGRMKLITGIKDTMIIDDSYHASPASIESGLQMLGEINVPGRKIAILGDMIGLGIFSEEEHKKIGAVIAETCDACLCVGVRSQYYIDGALAAGFPEENIFHFDDSQSAGKFIEQLSNPGDIMFVKGSRHMRMELAVLEIMQNPELAKYKLVN